MASSSTSNDANSLHNSREHINLQQFTTFEYSSRYKYKPTCLNNIFPPIFLSRMGMPWNITSLFETPRERLCQDELNSFRHYGRSWKGSKLYHYNYKPQDVDPLGAEDYLDMITMRHAIIPKSLHVRCFRDSNALVRVWGRTILGWILLWEAEDQDLAEPEEKPKVLVLKLRETNKTVNGLRLELNQNHLEVYKIVKSVSLHGVEAMADSSLSLMNDSEKKLSFKEQEEHSNNDGVDYFKFLPLDLILKIFGYLDLKSLCRAAQVNRRFYEFCLEPELYQDLDLKKYWHTVTTDTLHFLKDRCARLKKLNFSWCGMHGNQFDENFSQLLDQCQSTLTHITLDNRDFIGRNIIEALMKCKGLVELRLRNAHIGNDWSCLSNSEWKLETLDLSGCDIENRQLLEIINTSLKHLKHINIDFCQELVTNNIANHVAYKCSLESWSSFNTLHWEPTDGVCCFALCWNLIELNLGWCVVSEPRNCLTVLSEGCPNLERLNLSGWRRVDSETLAPIINNCKKLTHLSIIGVPFVQPELILKALNTLPNLQFLDLDYKIPESDVAEWKRVFPHVTIRKGTKMRKSDYNALCCSYYDDVPL